MDAATLGNFISTQRKKLGMTQKELAEALEINLVELMTCEIKDMGAEQIDNESIRETLDFSHSNGGRLQQSASSSLTASPPKSLSL